VTTEPAAKHAASIRDVAKVAGVSYQTVSRVLNDHPSIRPATRQRVLDAMSQLDFRPNRAARMLASNRSFTVGVLATVNGAYYGPTSSINAIEDAAREAGYSTLLASPRSMEAEELRDALTHLILEGVAGIVALAPQGRAAEVVATLRTPVPVVVMQSDPGLSVDNRLGGALAARHLLGLGHRRLALIAGPTDWSEAEERRAGFEATLAEAGLEPVAVAHGDWSPDSGYQAFVRIAEHSPTGLFCANDQMALGAIHAAADRGLSVPRDLSVIGFDDVPESAHYLPPLTTLRQEFEVLGRRSISSLLARVEGNAAEYQTPVTPNLIVRASTMPAPPESQGSAESL